MFVIREIKYAALCDVIPEKEEDICKFEIGDKVMWRSSGTFKTGDVIAIVPAGEVPLMAEPMKGYSFRSFGCGGARREISYIVGLHPKRHEKIIRLYWPCVKWLIKMKDGTK